MKIRKKIPTSQLIDASGVLVRPGWLLAGMCLAGVAKAIGPPFEAFYPPSAGPFGAGYSLSRFLSSSWAVILVLFMLAGGILGDLYGRRRVLLWSLGMLLLTNIALLFSPGTLWHVIWRLPANISAGLVVPLTLAPLYIFFEGRQRIIAFTIYFTTVAIGDYLSIYQGRLFIDLLNWRGAYLIPAVMSLIAIVIVRRSLPESRTANPRLLQAIFYAGWTILVLGMIYAIFEILLGREYWIVVLAIVLIVMVIGLGMILWWWRKEHRDARQHRSNQVRYVIVLILSGVIVQIAMLGFYSLTYSYYRVVHNLDFIQTLLSMSPMFIGILATAYLIARLWAHQRIRQMITIGFLVIAFAMAAMAVVAGMPYWVQILPLAVFGISIIATKTVWTNAFFQILIDRYIGLNAGMNSATLLVGGALGGVLTTELLAVFGQSAFVRQSTSLTLSEGALRSLFNNISATIAAGENLGVRNLATMVSTSFYTQYQQASIVGYALTMLVISLLCLLAAGLIYRGIRRSMVFKPEDTPLDDETDSEDEILQNFTLPRKNYRPICSG